MMLSLFKCAEYGCRIGCWEELKRGVQVIGKMCIYCGIIVSGLGIRANGSDTRIYCNIRQSVVL